jgi:ABC-type glycerol-3-phosphate transport system substrate-binding protein
MSTPGTLPLNDVVEGIGRDQFKTGAVLSLDESDYALGYAGGTHSVLWVRKDLFEAAGLEYPKTFEELLVAAEKLTQDTNEDGQIDIYGSAFGLSMALPISLHKLHLPKLWGLFR